LSVTTAAIDSIRTMIADGDLGPGDRLPPEHELAESLGVSRGSLREAVRALAQINVLDVRRGDGTYVTSLEPSELLSGLVFAIELLQVSGLTEVIEVRRLLLPPAAGLAAKRATKQHIERMRAVIAALESAESSQEVAGLHREFQAIVAEATGNESLSSILRALQLQSENVRRSWLNADHNAELALTHQKLLLAAIEARDEDLARSIATIQVDERIRWVNDLLRQTAATETPAADPT
jgi:GntR family transcriptional repressor for pyruvate dehydrogenase complex